MKAVARLAIAVAGLVLAMPGSGAAGEAAERARIAAERNAAQQRYQAAERECQTRFAVTDCLEAAQRERREALMRLRREETVLDEAQRKQRAAERVEMIRRKVSEESQAPRPTAARAPRDAAEPAPRVRVRDAAGAADEPASAAGPLRRGRVTVRPKAPATPSGAERAAQEARSRAAYEARQQAAQEHVEENRRRNEERAKSKPAAPLPAASAASR